MTYTIAVTGPQDLTAIQTAKTHHDLLQLLTLNTHLHLGDAYGVDQLAQQIARQKRIATVRHMATGKKPWQLQQRSKRMVDAIAQVNGTLHTWLNQPCPPDLTASNWLENGTWGIIYYAITQGVKIELHPLINLEMPQWLKPQRQMALR